MTLQQRFNLSGRVINWGGAGLVALWLLTAFVLFPSASDASKDEVLAMATPILKGGFFFLAFWFVPLPIILGFFEKCPSCGAHYSYRAPDLDGWKNRSWRADTHCHKCGQSFN